MEGPFRRADLTDPALRLIETIRWDGRGMPLWPCHSARLSGAAARFGWPCNPGAAEAALRAAARPGQPMRLRLTLDATGGTAIEAGPLPPSPPVWRLGLARAVLDPADPWLTVKSTRRAAYDAARAALPDGCDEAVFLNPAGEVCDGTITTLFFDRGGGLCTPPLSCGLLPGVLRAARIAAGTVREEPLPGRDLPRVRLWVGNALRGLMPARWAG